MTNDDLRSPSPFTSPHYARAPYGTSVGTGPLSDDPRFAPPPASYRPLDRPADMPRRRRGSTAAAGAALVAVALGSGAAGAEFATRRIEDRPAVATTPAGATVPVTDTAAAPREQLAQVAAAVQPSVVSIVVRGPNGGGEGSGVVLSTDGTILTNNHVVESGEGGRVVVKFSDGRQAEATIVGRDAGSDVAVIKAQNITGLKPATLGNDADLHVGDTVLAIGSPLGLEGSVSAGIVLLTAPSGRARRPYDDGQPR
jgi:putative serine protease PepD